MDLQEANIFRDHDLDAPVADDLDMEDNIAYIQEKDSVATSSGRNDDSTANKPQAAGGGFSSTPLATEEDDAESNALVATRGIGDQSRLEATDETQTKGSRHEVLRDGDSNRRNRDGSSTSRGTRQVRRREDPDFVYAYSVYLEQPENVVMDLDGILDVVLGHVPIMVNAAKIRPLHGKTKGVAVHEV